MDVRRVELSDVSAVKSLADSLQVVSDDARSGFYQYSLSLQDYRLKSGSRFFLVAERKHVLEGFCMAYDDGFVRHLVLRRVPDDVHKYLLGRNDDFVYVDQFAVRLPGSLGHGSAVELFDALDCRARYDEINKIVAAICHQPWTNAASIAFAERLGFALKDAIMSENVLLGIYERVTC